MVPQVAPPKNKRYKQVMHECISLLPPRPRNSKTTERGTSRPAARPGTLQPREKLEACFPTRAAASRDVSRSVVVVLRGTLIVAAHVSPDELHTPERTRTTGQSGRGQPHSPESFRGWRAFAHATPS